VDARACPENMKKRTFLTLPEVYLNLVVVQLVVSHYTDCDAAAMDLKYSYLHKKGSSYTGFTEYSYLWRTIASRISPDIFTYKLHKAQ
jgi:hypothetical protein